MEQTDLIRWALGLASGLVLLFAKEIRDRGAKRADEERHANTKMLEGIDSRIRSFQNECVERDETRRKRLHDLSDMLATTNTRVSILETVISERKKP